MSETLYKVLNRDGRCFHGGAGKWPLPVNSKPGKWMPVIRNLIPCKRGYHVLKSDQLLDWFGPAIFSVEIKGAVVWDGNKGVVSSARLLKQLQWDDQITRLFACDCAESVLYLTGSDRPIFQNSINISRLFAFGLADSNELAAARNAAWSATLVSSRDAAKVAARNAAWAAAMAAALDAARDTGSNAARAAAWAASREASWNAGWSAARTYQTKRLTAYLEGNINIKEIKRMATSGF